jgi:hydroxyacylglutathione hydrolase
MILERFYHKGLAQASYVVACPGAAEALVIDPNRDIDQYLEFAASEGVQIVGVLETHIHADYLSGSLELAERTGANLYLSGEGPEEWQYQFASHPLVRLVNHGDKISAGAIHLTVEHTPGHTPEHISFILTDKAASDTPLGAFTGDFLFVGDIGRPDLLERAAGMAGTMEAGANSLYRSIGTFASKYPDSLLIWPAHGSGSACGKSLGGVPVSSLGYEKQVNWALQPMSQEEFVAKVLAGQPDPPRYFAEMKIRNKVGPAKMSDRPQLVRAGQSPHEALVLDVRSALAIKSGSRTGAIGIPFGKSFVTNAGSLVPYDQNLSLIADSAEQAELAARTLALIGLDQVIAWSGPEGSNGALIEIVHPDEIGQSFLIDVRNAAEFAEGHVPGAVNLPLPQLATRLAELPKDQPIVVMCQSGARALVATTYLKRQFDAKLSSVGFSEWSACHTGERAGAVG